jgi:methylated-DNA-protein-cysteine methyltransferase related protein
MPLTNFDQSETTYKSKVFELVNQIPIGKVTNFGTIGNIVGISGQMVGWILSGMKNEEWNKLDCIPWYRVVSKDGSIASLKLGYKGEVQRQILLEQGYTIINDKVDMKKHFFDFSSDNLF